MLADLLRAAGRDPGNWEPWLVLADWLLEHDDMRGKLIQLAYQLETGDFPLGLPEEARPDMERESQLTWEVLNREVRERLTLPEGTSISDLLFGFPVAVVGTSGAVGPYLQELRKLPEAALLSSVTLYGPEATESILPSTLRGVRQLHVCTPYNYLPPEVLAGDLAALRHLRVMSTSTFTRGGMANRTPWDEVIAAAPGLSSLKLGSALVDVDTAAAICGGWSLRKLDLERSILDGPACAAMGDYPRFRQAVSTLGLRVYGYLKLDALFAQQYPSLQTLHLNRISRDAEVESITWAVRNGRLPALRRLSVGRSWVNARLADALGDLGVQLCGQFYEREVDV